MRLAAALRALRFRSARLVRSQVKTDAERKGQHMEQPLLRVIADAVRACGRGLGPGLRARALPLARLGALPGEGAPWAAGGPLGPRAALVVGSSQPIDMVSTVQKNSF
mgnify:CR=1 FL=1